MALVFGHNISLQNHTNCPKIFEFDNRAPVGNIYDMYKTLRKDEVGKGPPAPRHIREMVHGKPSGYSGGSVSAGHSSNSTHTKKTRRKNMDDVKPKVHTRMRGYQRPLPSTDFTNLNKSAVATGFVDGRLQQQLHVGQQDLSSSLDTPMHNPYATLKKQNETTRLMTVSRRQRPNTAPAGRPSRMTQEPSVSDLLHTSQDEPTTIRLHKNRGKPYVAPGRMDGSDISTTRTVEMRKKASLPNVDPFWQLPEYRINKAQSKIGSFRSSQERCDASRTIGKEVPPWNGTLM